MLPAKDYSVFLQDYSVFLQGIVDFDFVLYISKKKIRLTLLLKLFVSFVF